MPINPQTYEGVAYSLTNAGEQVTHGVAKALTDLHKQVIHDPDSLSKAADIYSRRVAQASREWSKNWRTWADKDLLHAYIQGVRHTDIELERLRKAGVNIRPPRYPVPEDAPLAGKLPPLTLPQNIPAQMKAAFSAIPNHLTAYNVFRRAAYHNLEGTSLQILRAGNDLYRDAAVQATSQMFRETDIYTRRQLSQSMLDEFAKKGLQSITYRNGRKVSIEAYSEMLGRTMSGHAAVQGSLNRYAEHGYNLVRVSAHFRACDLCIPWEGKILSIGGAGRAQERVSGAASATAAPATVPRTGVPAQTPLDAEKYLQTQLQVQADYTSVSGMDAKTADEINDALIRFNQQHPGAKNMIDRVKIVPENQINGAAYFQFDTREIRLNANYFGKGFDHAVERHLTDIKYNIHPKGTTWASVIHHEATHGILRDVERTHGADIFKKIKRESLKQAGMKIADVSKNLSSYAATDPEEFIAEAFGEFHTSDTPRDLSKTIVQTVGKYLRKGRGGG